MFLKNELVYKYFIYIFEMILVFVFPLFKCFIIIYLVSLSSYKTSCVSAPVLASVTLTGCRIPNTTRSEEFASVVYALEKR